MINQSFINKRKVVSSFAFLHSEFLGLKTIGLKINLTSKNVGSGDSLPRDVVMDQVEVQLEEQR